MKRWELPRTGLNQLILSLDPVVTPPVAQGKNPISRRNLVACIGFTLIWLLFAQEARAQQPIARFESFGQEDGLPQSTVISITQDHEGFLWVGTLDGLSRYDGYGFETFVHETDREGSLSNSLSLALLVDAEGRLWTGTAGGGLDRFDAVQKRFRHVPGEDGSGSSPVIYDLIQDESGRIWCGTRAGVMLLDDGETRFLPLPGRSPEGEPPNVTAMLVDREERMWVGTFGRGLYLLDRREERFQHQPVAGLEEDERIYSLLEDSNGVLWCGSERGLFHRRGTEPFQRHQLTTSPVSALLQDHRGSLWIGTHGRGVYRMLGDQIYHFPGKDRAGDISDSDIWTIFQDRNRVIWIGTDNGGLVKYRDTSFKHYRRGDEGSGLSHDQVWAIQEDRGGSLWVGTSGGLNRLDRHSGRIRRYFEGDGGLSSDKVRSLHETRAGVLWLGTHGGGLNRYDAAGDSFQDFRHDPQDPDSLGSNIVTALLEDSDGLLWVGTDRQLNAYDGKRFIRYVPDFDNPGRGPSDDFILTLKQDERGRLWIGTMGGGLDLWDGSRFISHRHRSDDPTSISNDQVTSIWQEPGSGDLWLGTYGGGLNRFDPEEGTARVWSTKEGLPNQVVYGVLGDGTGRLWLSTNRGIVCFDMLTERFRAYGLADGVQGYEFNKGAFFKSRRGELFFGGINGFNAFNGEDIVQDLEPPNVVLTDFLIHNVPIAPRRLDPDSPLETVINAAERLEIGHRERMISFEFAGLHLVDPAHNAYRYKLEGHDLDWIDTSADNRRATYTNLDAGKYTFKVMAANRDGVWSQVEKTLELRVHPPPWLSIWAKSFYAAVVILLALAFNQSQRNKLARQRQIAQNERKIAEQERTIAEKERAAADYLRGFNKELDQKVRQRTAQLEHKNEEILEAHGKLEDQAARLASQAKSLLEMNELKTRFFTNISHELRTPLTLLLGPLHELDEGGRAADPATTRLMVRNADRLLELINQLLDISRLEAGRVVLQPRELDLVFFVRSRAETFTPLAQSRRINLVFKGLDGERVTRFDPDKLEKVLYNLLSNAFKFTGEDGTVSVSLAFSMDSAVISVSDTGVGIGEDQLPYVFDRFFRGRRGSGPNGMGTGIGLSYARELMTLHGGDLSVTSALGEGSTFTAHLPLTSTSGQVEEAPEVGTAPALEVAEAFVAVENEEIADDQAPIVVLIEDNDDVRNYIQAQLSDRFRVSAANGPSLGLSLVWETVPDLIVCDVMMPEMDGFEVCQILKKDPRSSHIPIMLLTARGSVEHKTTGWRVGADAYMVKPFVVSELLALAENLIANRNSLQQRFNTRTIIQPAEVAANPADQAFLERLMEILEARFNDAEFSVHQLSEEIGLSRRQLLRKLTAMTGSGPADFIRDFRLERAAQLLRRKAGNISEIAYSVGFKSPAHFTARFHEHFGKPPSEYSKSG